MFATFLLALREARVPVSVTEYLHLLGAVRAGVAGFDPDEFYFLSRATLVKDERHLDRFDRVFGAIFRGAAAPGGAAEGPAARELPAEWLRLLAARHLTEAERAAIEAMGGFEKLMDTLRQRLEEQKGRHQGGSKWIGTGGTSPFGHGGYNPKGVRIGGPDGERGRERRAVKVWDRREFRDLDDDVALGTRGLKLALRRLRRFAREGAATELDMPGTVGGTARNGGTLDLRLRPERRNAARLLLFLDVGGSMDDHVRESAELFTAARAEFKHLAFFYFHNCPYEHVWPENRRRRDNLRPTVEVIRTFGPEYRCVFVGDATMSPYEITERGGSVEHWNEEPGQLWLSRMTAHWRRAAWLNPVPEQHWQGTRSIALIRTLLDNRMFPLNLAGVEAMTRALGH